MNRILDGHTESGRTVVVERGDSYRDVRIVIDGEKAEVHRSALYRDGGTVAYETSHGVVVFPRKMGDPDRTPRLDRERVITP